VRAQRILLLSGLASLRNKKLAIFLCATIVFVIPLGSCSNEEAFITADYAKCRELGFSPGEKEYDICLSEVQRRRLTLATTSEQNGSR
jgi:hypothetical protein